MKLYVILLLLFVLPICVEAQSNMSDYFNNSHDITSLPQWGPYSKQYAGISHIADLKSGTRFDFSVMPGFYRNRQLVPHVLFESSYYPWNISSSLRKITYRYELEWKDKVYVDVTYFNIDNRRVLVELKSVNNTDISQNITFNNIAYIDYGGNNSDVNVTGNDKLVWKNATDYVENEPEKKTAQYRLVYDGLKRNEAFSTETLDGSYIGKGFGNDIGDRLLYNVNIPVGKESGVIALRYRVKAGRNAILQFRGVSNEKVKLDGNGKFTFQYIPIDPYNFKNTKLEIISASNEAVDIDGFFIGDKSDIDNLRFTEKRETFIPQINIGSSKKDFVLKFKECDEYYGLAWNYDESVIRQIYNSELESFLRKKTHDHVSTNLYGDRKWYYANSFLRPVVLAPRSSSKIYMLLSQGSKTSVDKDMKDFHSNPDNLINNISIGNDSFEDNINPSGSKYMFGVNLLKSCLLSNIVYPVYTQGEYIRHFTPGKNWNSLYTWDSGFISLGLACVDSIKSFECLKAYTTDSSSESAFIHHGTPLPIQIFAYQELFNMTHSYDMLTYIYPRLKRFFDFMVGNDIYSSTSMSKSGLLRTWDYFYNSGGWDDYPPQKALSASDKEYITPVVSTAYYIRAAKIMRHFAQKCSKKQDIEYYDRIITRLSSSLQKYSWDDLSGYYGYVVHGKDGTPTDIFRYNNGINYNMGLDGVSPLISGCCTERQQEALTKHIFSVKELWTDVGISTVDKSAPYYKNDGYWNGAVWIPHQWMIWKSMLDMGKGNEAYKIAKTILECWQKECSESYFTFEHFIISSKRGAGWHQFSGLSSPVLNLFYSYYKKGIVSAGFEVYIDKMKVNEDYSQCELAVSIDNSSKPHQRCILIVLNPKYEYTATYNGKIIKTISREEGQVELYLPSSNTCGKIQICKI